MIEVRPARAGEAAACDALVAAAFQPLRAYYRPTAAARRRLAKLSWSRLVAIEAGTLAGCCEFRVDGRILRLRALAVLAHRRRRGIARRLIAAVEDAARRLKCRVLRLFAIRETGNEAAFRGLGFRTVASRTPDDYESPTGGSVTEVEMERVLLADSPAWTRLCSSRGSLGLVLGIPGLRPFAPDLWRSLFSVAAGTQAFALRICRKAGKRLGHRVRATPVRVPKSTDRTDPAWYRTRARGGSVRLALLRAFKKLAVSELPLLEAHVGRRASPLFRKRAPARWDAGLPKDGVRALEFRRAAKRWVNLVTAKATWLSLRLAEVATKSTGDPAGARETLRVCAAVASRPRQYDPFNTFAAFLEAFHRLAAAGPRPLSALLDDSRGTSIFRKIALEAGPGKRWRSGRARELARVGLSLRRRGGPCARP